MVPSFLVTFREALEAALVVGIVLGYLARTGQRHHNRVVYAGVATGAAASGLGALLFAALAGGFEGRAEELFEGITMLVGAGLLTTMILWMMRQHHIAAELEAKVATTLRGANRAGLFALVFVAILREGIETVLFLSAASIASPDNNLIGAVAGLVAAVALGYALFVGSLKISLRSFFAVTNALLILFAAGLVGMGVHELQEAGVLPVIVEHVWDINPPAPDGGPYPALHDKGAIGGIMRGLFGYSGTPSLLQVVAYGAYLGVVAVLWHRSDTRSSAGAPAAQP
ncbi:MAG: FTR1 family protein [Chloroflexi bacterium]|nr:FTR1 family protein [Chloroflexota bacterium]